MPITDPTDTIAAGPELIALKEELIVSTEELPGAEPDARDEPAFPPA